MVSGVDWGMASFTGLGKALRWIRQRQGKKQYEVAEAAHITKAMLSSYENEKQRPTIETLERILDALEIDLEYLAYALRSVTQDERRRSGGGPPENPSIAPPTLGPFLDIERLLGLGRRLEPAEERAVGRMIEGFHALLRYFLTQSPGPTDADETSAGDARSSAE